MSTLINMVLPIPEAGFKKVGQTTVKYVGDVGLGYALVAIGLFVFGFLLRYLYNFFSVQVKTAPLKDKDSPVDTLENCCDVLTHVIASKDSVPGIQLAKGKTTLPSFSLNGNKSSEKKNIVYTLGDCCTTLASILKKTQ